MTDGSVDALADSCAGARVGRKAEQITLNALRPPPCPVYSAHAQPLAQHAAVCVFARMAGTLHTLDVVGCTGVTGRDPAALRAKLPRLTCFLTHS